MNLSPSDVSPSSSGPAPVASSSSLTNLAPLIPVALPSGGSSSPSLGPLSAPSRPVTRVSIHDRPLNMLPPLSISSLPPLAPSNGTPTASTLTMSIPVPVTVPVVPPSVSVSFVSSPVPATNSPKLSPADPAASKPVPPPPPAKPKSSVILSPPERSPIVQDVSDPPAIEVLTLDGPSPAQHHTTGPSPIVAWSSGNPANSSSAASSSPVQSSVSISVQASTPPRRLSPTLSPQPLSAGSTPPPMFQLSITPATPTSPDIPSPNLAKSTDSPPPSLSIRVSDSDSPAFGSGPASPSSIPTLHLQFGAPPSATSPKGSLSPRSLPSYQMKRPNSVMVLKTSPKPIATNSRASVDNHSFGLSLPSVSQIPPSPIGEAPKRRNSDPKVNVGSPTSDPSLPAELMSPFTLGAQEPSSARFGRDRLDSALTLDRNSSAAFPVPKYRSHDWTRPNCSLKIKRQFLVSPPIQALLAISDGRIACAASNAIRIYTLPIDQETDIQAASMASQSTNVSKSSNNSESRSPSGSPLTISPNLSPRISPSGSPKHSQSRNAANSVSQSQNSKVGQPTKELDGSDKSLRELKLPGSVGRPTPLSERRLAISFLERIEIWRVNQGGGEKLSEIPIQIDSACEAVVELPDQRIAAVGKENIKVISLNSCKVDLTLRGKHTSVVAIPAISPPPNPLEKLEAPAPIGHSAPFWLTGIRDGIIRVWDPSSGLHIVDLFEPCTMIDYLRVPTTAHEAWSLHQQSSGNPAPAQPHTAQPHSHSHSSHHHHSLHVAPPSTSRHSAHLHAPPNPHVPSFQYSMVQKMPNPARFIVTMKERYFKIFRLSWEPWAVHKERKRRKRSNSNTTSTGEAHTPRPVDDSPRPINEANPPAFHLVAREVCCIYKMSEFGFSSILALQDGRLAVGTRDGGIRIFAFDIISESLRHESSWSAHTGSKRFVEHLCELPDGRLVTAVGSQKNRSMKIWSDHGSPIAPTQSKDCAIM